LPTDTELSVLNYHLCGTSLAGGKIKSTCTVPEPNPNWKIPYTGATDESQWSGLPSGNRRNKGWFDIIGYYGFFWSSTEYSSEVAWYWILDYSTPNLTNGHTFIKSFGFSLRCLKD
jgi:uncharacterized protein (TIGR02145 family)